MFVYVGGILGVGKTTIVATILKNCGKTGLVLQGMDEGAVLRQLAGVLSAQAYHDLPEEIRANARQKMVARFYALDRQDPDKIRVRDDHFAYLRQDKTIFIRPQEADDNERMLAFIVVIVDPKEILDRRMNDRNRPERTAVLEEIANHQNMEIQTAALQSVCLNVPLLVVENKDGEYRSTVQTILAFIKASMAARGEKERR